MEQGQKKLEEFQMLESGFQKAKAHLEQDLNMHVDIKVPSLPKK